MTSKNTKKQAAIQVLRIFQSAISRAMPGAVGELAALARHLRLSILLRLLEAKTFVFLGVALQIQFGRILIVHQDRHGVNQSTLGAFISAAPKPLEVLAKGSQPPATAF